MAVNISYAEALKKGWIAPDEVPAAEKSARRKKDLEGTEQAELVQMVRTAFPVEGQLLIHIPNGGSRKNAFEGWRLKQQGTREGVSDLLLPVARGGYHGLWIEFKATPPFDARVSPAQKQWLQLMQAEGYAAHLAKGPSAAFDIISQYLTLPRERSAIRD